jgi:hypothetical protein
MDSGQYKKLFMTLLIAEFGEEKFGETSWRLALFRRHQVQPKSRPAGVRLGRWAADRFGRAPWLLVKRDRVAAFLAVNGRCLRRDAGSAYAVLPGAARAANLQNVIRAFFRAVSF